MYFFPGESDHYSYSPLHNVMPLFQPKPACSNGTGGAFSFKQGQSNRDVSGIVKDQQGDCHSQSPGPDYYLGL